jgi:hypothetical protein
MTESRAGRIGRRRAGRFTYPNRTAANGRWRWRRLRSRRRPGVAAPGHCWRQPRARSALRGPFRHLASPRCRAILEVFVLRAIDRLDDRTALSADPDADDPDPPDFRIGRRASGGRRRGGRGGATAWFLPSPYWGFREQRNVVHVGGATDAAQRSGRMISGSRWSGVYGDSDVGGESRGILPGLSLITIPLHRRTHREAGKRILNPNNQGPKIAEPDRLRSHL